MNERLPSFTHIKRQQRLEEGRQSYRRRHDFADKEAKSRTRVRSYSHSHTARRDATPQHGAGALDRNLRVCSVIGGQPWKRSMLVLGRCQRVGARSENHVMETLAKHDLPRDVADIVLW